jgi:4-hydroxy-3-methylbut-2-enyl diphosphate reductase
MEVRMAEHMGMCFGVRDAIELAETLARRAPLTILGDLVHNPDVLAQMDKAGAKRARSPKEVTTSTLLLTAHGTSDRVKKELHLAGYEVHDATCPLVKKVHIALAHLVEEGRHPVIIGQPDHVEVRGLVGDLDEYTIVLKECDLVRLDDPARSRGRLGVVAQTTQPLGLVLKLVGAIRSRFPFADIRFIDTVCQPTKDRQEAMRRLVEEVDVVVVVGGRESNNSRKLAELARARGKTAHQVASASELRPQWFADARIVGMTAGTSTPKRAIDEVRLWLESFQPSQVLSRESRYEDEALPG